MRLLLVPLLAALVVGCRRQDPFAGNSCVNRLRMIDGAKQTWMSEHHKTTNDAVAWSDIAAYLPGQGMMPTCPAGGTYTLGKLGEPPRCSLPGHQLP
jgi:hypothetical protein